jgi:hypothetical protein
MHSKPGTGRGRWLIAQILDARCSDAEHTRPLMTLPVSLDSPQFPARLDLSAQCSIAVWLAQHLRPLCCRFASLYWAGLAHGATEAP